MGWIMNKKGFTLIELLGVIVILSILALLTSTIVFKLISNSRKDLYKEQIEIIERAAEKWSIDNVDLVGQEAKYCLSIDKLVTGGYIEKDTLNDPRDNSKITGYVEIIYDSDYKQYDYKYNQNNTCIN